MTERGEGERDREDKHILEKSRREGVRTMKRRKIFALEISTETNHEHAGM